ncbi:MAG: RDD family protein [Firmicutes bacterium]|nr:RDD family protein [Candidatus Fiminaster equi]
MKQRKYTLPRHTNLAKQSSRTGAFLIDVAVFGVFLIAFLFGCFRLILNPVAEPYKKELETEQVNSHLRYRDENGDPQIIPTESSYEEYRNVISSYYINYLTGNVTEPGTGSRLANEKIKNDDGVEVSKSEYYTIPWFNRTVLKIVADDPEQDSSCLFTYEKVDGVYDKTKFGIPKDATKVKAEDINKHMQDAYLNAYINHFNKLSYIVDLSNKSSFIYSLEFVLSGLLAGICTYIIIPIIIKKGRTVGKLVFKLSLANSDGYKMDNKQLIMRIVPLVVVLASFLIPLWSDIFLVVLIPLIIFLVSFALAMASPKKASLHDFVARTIVIDDRTSIIFENEIEEEDYLIKEDNLEVEIKEAGDGEEPEISYEK